jgi:hypothetical protein
MVFHIWGLVYYTNRYVGIHIIPLFIIPPKKETLQIIDLPLYSTGAPGASNQINPSPSSLHHRHHLAPLDFDTRDTHSPFYLQEQQ